MRKKLSLSLDSPQAKVMMFSPPQLTLLQNIIWMAAVVAGIFFCYLGQGYFAIIFLAMGSGFFLFFCTNQGLARMGKPERIPEKKRP
jgi:hypothetical protein